MGSGKNQRYRGKPCAYCGCITPLIQGEHVVPKSLYPTKADPRVQRAKVPACPTCNKSFMDDEPHFRSVMTIAGPDVCAGRHELFTISRRSWGPEQKDGLRRLEDVFRQMIPVEGGKWPDGSRQHMVFPGKDPRVMRIIRKIIRGLCVWKGWLPFVPDERVWANVNIYEVPPEFRETQSQVYQVPGVVVANAHLFDPDVFAELHSGWTVKVFAVEFIGAIVPAQIAGAATDT